MTAEMWILLGCFFLIACWISYEIGYVAGRRAAENRRARFDMGRTWKERKDYRDG